jgi:hypothetical protein
MRAVLISAGWPRRRGTQWQRELCQIDGKLEWRRVRGPVLSFLFECERVDGDKLTR